MENHSGGVQVKKLFAILPFCLLLAGCPTTCPKPDPSPLAAASCPEIQPPSDPSFGATTYTLVQQAGQYKKCRAAALGAGK